MLVEFELEGQRFMGLNAGPYHKFNEAVSFFVKVETQQEVDELWAKLTADGGAPGQCGWLKDKFGLSWQIIPEALTRLMSGPDPAGAPAHHAGDDGNDEDRRRAAAAGLRRIRPDRAGATRRPRS